jgi:hypothetical protein
MRVPKVPPAPAIVDYHLIADLLRHFLTEHARKNVGGAQSETAIMRTGLFGNASAACTAPVNCDDNKSVADAQLSPPQEQIYRHIISLKTNTYTTLSVCASPRRV